MCLSTNWNEFRNSTSLFIDSSKKWVCCSSQYFTYINSHYTFGLLIIFEPFLTCKFRWIEYFSCWRSNARRLKVELFKKKIHWKNFWDYKLTKKQTILFSIGDMPCPIDDEDHIKCPFTTACINKDWLCDDENDCWDHWDEQNCTTIKKRTCSSSQFRCRDDSCIPIEKKCDGNNDCDDAIPPNGSSSDEELCKFPEELLKYRIGH